ncbi:MULTISPECIES: AAA family ATPase [Brevibacillus]|uniref:AAA family ATPase n=1 Tax=Brevibacillus TaxID=55080 RepID=UPI00046830D4|nr:AAA family ATPase [Brevibacillus borstelensis]MCC0562783.1 AAA family ATPase [Brevibacillus borstelensis]MCM3469440.1 AAA family ATPase [Brevibacillus borstelensis]MCM3557325.1 AAA family ATPase [Brevibacillus borstelensis]MCM3590899.1 AAA family ATPase [Brevibacillus borstelensis]MCM3625440.1 AAA family ATPase [Brevibacillus borstelensis]
MGKEIVCGAIPAILVFLWFLGINVTPLLVFGVVLLALYFLVVRQSQGNVSFGGKGKQTKNVVPKSNVQFAEIGGQERAKNELKEALDFLKHKDQIAQYGIRPLKGVLLTGPPGTGKTLMAKAAANYTNSAFVAASGSQFVEMYVGVGAQRVRDLFKEVKALAEKNGQDSGIIFIDEIDVIGGKRDGQQQREYDQTLNQLLTEMDGIGTSEKPRILMIAATNRKDMLDSALLRPGRFDRHISVDLPDKTAREQILVIHTANKPLAPDVSLEQVAQETFGFSGAQLESVANEAAIYAMREKSPQIEARHFAFAVDKVMMGEKVDREASAEEKKRVALHELGHAIVSETVRPGSVSQVTLSPRGKALGYVRQNPMEDRYLYTKEALEKQIMVCLGGAVAEEIYYGGRSTGSKNDFEQALNMAQEIVQSGMSGLGIVHLQYVAKERVHDEVERILEDLLEKTRTLLSKYDSVFQEGLHTLLQAEVLHGDAFRSLLASVSTPEKELAV